MGADVDVGAGGGWVLCGCKHGCGAVRAVGGGGVWGLEHRRTPTCLPAWLVPQAVILYTIHYHGTVVPVRTRDHRTPGAQPSSIKLSPASKPQSCTVLRHLEAHIAKAQDGGDRSTGQWIASLAIILLQETRQYPPIPSSPPLATDDICTTQRPWGPL